MDDTDQIPGPLFPLEYQTQAPPIQPCELRIESLKVILYGDRLWIHLAMLLILFPTPTVSLKPTTCGRAKSAS
jgi:hypothetical protein